MAKFSGASIRNADDYSYELQIDLDNWFHNTVVFTKDDTKEEVANKLMFLAENINNTSTP